LPEQYRRKATWRHVSTETAKAADGNKDLLEICVSLRLVLALEGVEMPNAMTDDLPNEETDNPLLADDRNYYKVEKWTKDGTKVDRMLYAGNNLDKARQLFANVQLGLIWPTPPRSAVQPPDKKRVGMRSFQTAALHGQLTRRADATAPPREKVGGPRHQCWANRSPPGESGSGRRRVGFDIDVQFASPLGIKKGPPK
jgi:hypothetical protein